MKTYETRGPKQAAVAVQSLLKLLSQAWVERRRVTDNTASKAKDPSQQAGAAGDYRPGGPREGPPHTSNHEAAA